MCSLDGIFRFRISGFGTDVDDGVLRSHFESYGEVMSLEYIVMPGKSSGGVSTASLLLRSSGKLTRAAVFSDRHELNGRLMTISDDPSRKVFVRGLQAASAEDVHAYFANFGRLEEVDVALPDGNGKPRGLSYVRFAEQAGLDAALTQPQHKCLGATLTLVPAERRQAVQATTGRSGKLENHFGGSSTHRNRSRSRSRVSA